MLPIQSGSQTQAALHEGLKAKLTLIRPISDTEREVLRVFKTDRLILNHDRRDPLYLVSLTREKLDQGFNLYSIPRSMVARTTSATCFGFPETQPMIYMLAENKVNNLNQGMILTVP